MVGNKDRAAKETYYYSVEYETGSPNHQQLVNAHFHGLCSLNERAVANVMNLKVVLEVDEEMFLSHTNVRAPGLRWLSVPGEGR